MRKAAAKANDNLLPLRCYANGGAPAGTRPVSVSYLRPACWAPSRPRGRVFLGGWRARGQRSLVRREDVRPKVSACVCQAICQKLQRSGGACARLSSYTIALFAVVICGLSGFLAYFLFYDDVYPCKHSKQIPRAPRQPCEASASTAGTPALG